ncbi:DUF6371 domain-containing protein [Mangrovibacterium diazotrophicum]|uniref:Uncharacterized protein n=1 Tax=Mangrovibacterium diazotrophicum TaxID=1261403 RepID=A0A419W4M9_9BACT|nr:DUF6371 domain-containing protein [Mangrovibacterium diazotrophicum]RKD90421.1 hypothetical protein BC643_0760 [Mangrovibacterium diazotrophicum]
MQYYRYILDKSSRKFICPDCGKKRFVRYVDIETGNYLPEKYGRCDKGDGHHFLDPYSDGYAQECSRSDNKDDWKPPKPKPASTIPVYFDFETFKKTLKGYEQNTFIQNLMGRIAYPFDVDEMTKVVELYRLGTITKGYRAGAVTFPFIDITGNVRAIQVKQFDESNHTTGTDFLHSIIEKDCIRNNQPLPDWLKAYKAQEKRISCLFGEHLLGHKASGPVALVEAPKTAIYGALYFPKITWLAVYNKSSFSIDKLKVLAGRSVYVFPDLSRDGSTFAEWQAKAEQYQEQLPGTRFIFSDLLEKFAPKQDKENGNDIADYLIQQDWKEYRECDFCEKSEAPKTTFSPTPEQVYQAFSVAICEGCPPTAFCVPEFCPKAAEFLPETTKSKI